MEVRLKSKFTAIKDNFNHPLHNALCEQISRVLTERLRTALVPATIRLKNSAPVQDSLNYFFNLFVQFYQLYCLLLLAIDEFPCLGSKSCIIFPFFFIFVVFSESPLAPQTVR